MLKKKQGEMSSNRERREVPAASVIVVTNNTADISLVQNHFEHYYST